MNAPPNWSAKPHETVQELTPNLWRVQAPVPGMTLKRVMTVVRMNDGGLIVHSAIAMDDMSMQRLEAWGDPRYIIVPNAMHRADCGQYKLRYPHAKIVCPKGARSKVEQVVGVDLDYDEFPRTSGISLRHLPGTKAREGSLVVQHEGHCTLILNDIVFNMPHASGFVGWMLRYVTQSSGGPRISRIAKLGLVDDAAMVAEALRELARTPGLERIIVSHHEMITQTPSETLIHAANRLHPGI